MKGLIRCGMCILIVTMEEDDLSGLTREGSEVTGNIKGHPSCAQKTPLYICSYISTFIKCLHLFYRNIYIHPSKGWNNEHPPNIGDFLKAKDWGLDF